MRQIVTVFIFFLLAGTLFAGDEATLTKMLNDFLAGASRNDAAIHEQFWADDLIYTSSSGKRMGKAEILRDVRSETTKSEGPVYTAEDIRIQQYGDTAIVAFHLVEKEKGTTVGNYLNTGTFLKRNGKWQVVAWQATKMPGS
jgi:ketosteroid isomerase-like protein